MLRQVLRVGSITVTLPSGQRATCGDATGHHVNFAIHDTATLRRLLRNPELATGESYTNGTLTIENDDLHGFLAIVVANVGAQHLTRWMRLLDWARTLIRKTQQYNPIGKAQANVAHHYDLSGTLYDLFLDSDKQYSCGYFRTPNDTLEQAQAQKKAHIAEKLLLEPGMRVLDIGCGWGGMALTLARDFGVQVVGVTLSQEQHKIATARARAEGLADRVDFRLMDYRQVDQVFDRIVSVGMFEHVGVPHYGEYFTHVHDKLAPDGVALIHTIGRVTPPGSTNPWVDRYIFPGGYAPALSEIMQEVEKTGLWTTDIEVWRLHYAETLRHWHDRFAANRDRATALYDARFFRMWAFYLVASEMAFRHNSQCVFQVQLSRDRHAVPLTRDYIYPVNMQATKSHAAE